MEEVVMKSISEFDPNFEKLAALVAESAGIVEVNLDDSTQLETVKKARIKLRDARVLIEKTGTAYRADALKYQREVIAKEKDLIAIIEPEEQRLKEFEKAADVEKARRIRVAQMPERRQRLESSGFPVDEARILDMDSVAFETHFNELVAEKNRQEKEAADKKAAADKADLDRREAAVKEGERKLEEEKNAREREEKARADERARIEREATEKKQREEREAAEQKERDEKARKDLEKKQAYQKFLDENGYTKENAADFKQENTGDTIVLWKKIGTFRIK